jgi:hypothetical protein
MAMNRAIFVGLLAHWNKMHGVSIKTFLLYLLKSWGYQSQGEYYTRPPS